MIARSVFLLATFVSCWIVGSGEPRAASPAVRSADEAVALLRTLPEVPYDPHDSTALYRVEGGDRPDEFDACSGLYTSAGNDRRRQIFDVSKFGARGTGESRRFGDPSVTAAPLGKCGLPPSSPQPEGAACRRSTDAAAPAAPGRGTEAVDRRGYALGVGPAIVGRGSARSRNASSPAPSQGEPQKYIVDLAGLVKPASKGPERGASASSSDCGCAEFESADEWDWIGIQAAIVAAHRSGGGTVVIPDTGADYLVNRGIWVYSNVNLVWLTEPSRKRHSYVRLTAPTKSVGSVIGPYNPYRKVALPFGADEAERDARKAIENNRIFRSDAFVCRVALIEPRVKSISGENAVSFAVGSYGINIVGGHLVGARFGTSADAAKGFNQQGGKGIQLESGVQQVVVDGTRVSDSTIGISSSAGHFLELKQENPGRFERFMNASDRILVRNVVLERNEMPFFFAGTKDPRNSVAPQSVVVEGFRVSNSGLLRTIPKNPYPDEDVKFQAGIVNLLGASNIFIRKGAGGAVNVVANDAEIGAFVRGFGDNVHIADVRIDSAVRSLVDTHTALGKLAAKPDLKNFSLVSTTIDRMPGSLLTVPEPVVDPQRPPGATKIDIDVDVVYRGRRDANARPSSVAPNSGEPTGPRRLVVRID